MDRFETESIALLPGQRVQAKILSRERWGVVAQIVGYEHIAASVDMIEQFGALRDPELLEAMCPPVGSVIDAVVEQVRRWFPPAWVRLSIRPRDLELFMWPCGFCGKPVALSPGGGGLVLDVRSNDGPGSHTVISHRECLADRLHPDQEGERARALKLGTQTRGAQAGQSIPVRATGAKLTGNGSWTLSTCLALTSAPSSYATSRGTGP